MNPTPTTDTQRLRELMAAATQGEHRSIGNIVYVSGITANVAIFNRDRDAILHIALRNAAPALLDELRVLRSVTEKQQIILQRNLENLSQAIAERDKLREEVERLQAALDAIPST